MGKSTDRCTLGCSNPPTCTLPCAAKLHDILGEPEIADDADGAEESTDNRGISQFLSLLGLASLLTIVFAESWQMAAVGGATAVGVATIAVWRECANA